MVCQQFTIQIIGASLSEPLLVSSMGEMSVCMYVQYVRPFKYRCVYLLQFLVYFNSYGRAVLKPKACVRFSHIGYPAQWIAFLLHVISPTINLDGKRGFSREENVSGSKERKKDT